METNEAKIIGYCRACGKALDAASGHAVLGSMYCAEHLPAPLPGAAQGVPAPAAAPPMPVPSSSPYIAPFAPEAATAGTGQSPHAGQPSYAGQSPYTVPLNPPPLPQGDPSVSPAVAFALGMIPGVGAVYNRQYAKGLVHVVILGLMFSILGNNAARGFEPLFGILIPCFWFYMAFEAYHTAKKRQRGEPVEEFSGLVSGGHGAAGTAPGAPLYPPAKSSRFPVSAVLLIAIGVFFLLDNLDIIRIGNLLRYWPALLIVLGAYLLYERLTEARNERH
jgi:hypothetical protein